MRRPLTPPSLASLLSNPASDHLLDRVAQDFDAATHLPRLISSLEKQFFAGKDAILEGFTYGCV